MLAGLFRKLKKKEGLANYLPFRNALESIYTTLNKLFGATSYIDLATDQSTTTPIITNGNLEISSDSPLTNAGQIVDFHQNDYLPEITESDLKRVDTLIPGPSNGSLAHGTYSGSNNTTNVIPDGDFPIGSQNAWNLYNDGLGTSPTDGIGGTSIGLTKITSTTDPISGGSDFVFSYTGNSPTGQGVSLDFSILPENAKSSHKLTFNYRTSANYNTGNVKVFLLNKSTNTLINISNNVIQKTNNILTFNAEFQKEDDSTELRLIYHVSYLNSQTWSINIDNLEVSGFSNSSTLYYYYKPARIPTISGYQMVKLGWSRADGFFNNSSTFAQKYTGWVHGTGNYRILTSSSYVDISFDHVMVLDSFSGGKDIVSGTLTQPVSNFNIRIAPGSVGLNSVDNGTLTSDTGYYVYLLYNPETFLYGGILSTSRVAPLLPQGYTSFQRLGWIRSANSTGFFPSLQINDRFLYLQDPPTQTTFTTSSAGLSSNIAVSIISPTIENPVNHAHRSLLKTVDMRCKSNFTTGTTAYRSASPINTFYYTTNYNFLPYSSISAGVLTDNTGDYWNDVSLSQGASPNYGISLIVSNDSAVQTTFNIEVIGFEFRDILLQ